MDVVLVWWVKGQRKASFFSTVECAMYKANDMQEREYGSPEEITYGEARWAPIDMDRYAANKQDNGYW